MNPTDSHSLALVIGSGYGHANSSIKHFAFSSLVSLLDEEFEVLSEKDLALLTRRFERMYQNRKDSRRVTSTCYRCGKMGHFITECPEEVKNDYNRKHQLRDEYKHRSKKEYHSRHKNKEERKPKKQGGYKKSKARVMVADASDVDTRTTYTTSSSSNEDEDCGHSKEKKHLNRNFNGLSCTALSNVCTMAHSFDHKRNDHSDSDSEDEVGGLDNFWLIDSSCLRHMTGFRKWFSGLTLVVSKEYITFGDNGRGRVLSEGAI